MIVRMSRLTVATMAVGCGVLALAGCGANADETAGAAPATQTVVDGSDVGVTENPVETAPGDGSAAGFAMDRPACDYLSADEVADAFGASDVTPEAVRDKSDHRICRYEVILADGAYSALIVGIRSGDAAGVPFSDYLATVAQEGLAVDGFDDVVQEFAQATGPGDDPLYSGNLAEDKNLIFRLGDSYLINLEYSKWNDGVDIGDFSATLSELADAVGGTQ